MKLFIDFIKPPGDVLCLLGALREINKHEEITFSIGGPHGELYPDLTANNPLYDSNITREGCDKVVKPDYGQGIRESDEREQGHFTEALCHNVANQLGLVVPYNCDTRPAIYLTDSEKHLRPVQQPYWVFFAGGKVDFTAKWWTHDNWQEVATKLSTFVPDMNVVQVGATGPEHYNFQLRNVQNMVGQTTLRQLLCLIYHSEGVVCGITSGMHVAGAFGKPCVVIAGGREGPWWEKYDEHTFIHTVGQLSCCNKPCWCSHVDDSTAKANPSSKGGVCVNASLNKDAHTSKQQPAVPSCMSKITPNLVLNAIKNTYTGNKMTVTPKKRKTVASRKDLFQDVTIMVCLYGTDQPGRSDFHDLHRRCIGGILSTLTPSEAERVQWVLGCNEVDPKTMQYLGQKLPQATFVVKDKNVNKYPIMREMMGKVRTSYALWFDDDSYPTKLGWLTKVVNLFIKTGVAVGGREYTWPILDGQLEWIQKASWFSGMAPHVENREMRIRFITGGFQIFSMDAIRKMDWPDPRLDHNGGDVMMGEAVRQTGQKIVNLSLDKYGIVVSGAKRRGTNQRSAGARSMRRARFSRDTFYFTEERLGELLRHPDAELVLPNITRDVDTLKPIVHKLAEYRRKVNAGGCKGCNRKKYFRKIEECKARLIEAVKDHIIVLDEQGKERLLQHIRAEYNTEVKTVYYPSIGMIIGEDNG